MNWLKEEFKELEKLCNLYRADIESMRVAILDFYERIKELPNPEDRDSNFDELCDLMCLDEGEVIERVRKQQTIMDTNKRLPGYPTPYQHLLEAYFDQHGVYLRPEEIKTLIQFIPGIKRRAAKDNIAETLGKLKC